MTLGYRTLDLKTGTDRVVALVNDAGKSDYSVTSRQQAVAAGTAMAKDNLITGWGAGGFRFRFPSYQQNYPEIWQMGGQRLLWEHAHNDFLQTLIELGLVGSMLLVLGLIYGLWKFTLHRGWTQWFAVTLLLGLGLGLVLAHAWVDFPFQNPAILLTWLSVGTALLRWLELEDKTV